MNCTNRDGNHNNTPDSRVMLLLANTLDCDALLALFSGQQKVGAVEASSNLEIGLAKCCRMMPHVLIIDPKLSADIVQRALEAIKQRYVESIIVLDDRLHDGRLVSILKLPEVGYMTRQSGFAALLTATMRTASQGGRAFDPTVMGRLRNTSRGLRLELAKDKPTVAALTTRETEVLKLLACGHSVRNCAEQLDLAESTIDNHKSRLMRKLQVHKAAELTQIAIRDGLIIV